MEKTDPVFVDPDIFDRPDAERMVELVIESPPTNYDIIVGDHGAGKSTLVYRLARRLPGIAYHCAGLMLRPVARSSPREIFHPTEICVISWQALLTEYTGMWAKQECGACLLGSSVMALLDITRDHVYLCPKSRTASKERAKRERTPVEPVLDSAEGTVTWAMPGNLRARRYTSVDFPAPWSPTMMS